MGLDMYIKRIKKVDGYSFEEMMEFRNKIYDMPDPLIKEKDGGLPDAVRSNLLTTTYFGRESLSLTLELAYWRKAHMIHEWFVRFVQDGVDMCEPHEVFKKQLEVCLKSVQDALKESRAIDKGIRHESDVSTVFGYAEEGSQAFEHLLQTESQLITVLNYTDFDEYHVV